MKRSAKKPPIAIIGIGCRLPGGASNPDKLWELLLNKQDAVITVPKERWDIRKFYNPDQDTRHDKIATTQGGFLREQVDGFDADFFEMSPREANSMDPQQRLLMEVSFEAIEDAGITTHQLSNSNTGVYVGGFTFDYTLLQLDRKSRHLLNPSVATGSMLTMISNRLSYLYDLKGPSITIDTACSSSLVALHYACRDIWAGECDMAISGGVNLMLIPSASIVMSAGKFLSKDGRCRTFDRDASGYVRGEGAGIVLLKPLDKAIKDGDKIYGLIRSTGVNQDGKTNGITTPNYESQKKLIKKVYEEADLNINDLHYIEAHGTGTQAGDPVEFRALSHVLTEKGYNNGRCFVGSVKSNIGHLEAGAGVAGLIKAVLCLKNKQVPPNLHFNAPNPGLNYEESPLRVPQQVEDLPRNTLSYAGINSFGYGGTNAHVLLQEYKAAVKSKAKIKKEVKDRPFIFQLSAGSKAALSEMAKVYVAFIGDRSNSLEDILYNTTYRKSQLRHRLAIAARSREELIDRLQDFISQTPAKGIVYNERVQHSLKTAFIFTGMGPQWWKMGRELYEKEPVFREALLECDRIFKKISSWSVIDELLKDEDKSTIKDTCIAQPANFFIQYGLVRLLNGFGIKADAFAGHSVGEVASTYFSGALTLEEALTVSYHRSRLQSTAAGKGAMLAVSLTRQDAADLLQGYSGVSIAAINSPHSLTLAGDEDSLADIALQLSLKGIFNRVLDVEVPYHSPLMDPIRDELLESLSALQPATTTTDLYSTVSGHKIDGTQINNEYWFKNVRDSVDFTTAIEQLAKDGVRLFVEIGPHPVLKTSIQETLKEIEHKAVLLDTMNRKESEQMYLYQQLGQFYTIGYPLDLSSITPVGNKIDLPRYQWQHAQFWNEGRASKYERTEYQGNLFLSQKIPDYYPSYEIELNRNFFPFMDDHIVQGKVIFPGAGYVVAAIALAGKEVVSTGGIITLEDIAFHQMLFVSSARNQFLNSRFFPKTSQFQIFSHSEDEHSDQWQMHAFGRIAQGGLDQLRHKIDLAAIRSLCDQEISPEEFYATLAKGKLQYGPLFRGVVQIRKSSTEVLAEIEAPQGLDNNESYIHPVLLDCCFQSMIALLPGKEVVPVSIRKIHCLKPAGRKVVCYGTAARETEAGLSADIYICDEDGEVCLLIEGFECKEMNTAEATPAVKTSDLLYYPVWEKIRNNTTTAPGNEIFYIYGTEADAASLLCKEMIKRSASAFMLGIAGSSADDGTMVCIDTVNPGVRTDFTDHLLQQSGPVTIILLSSWSADSSRIENASAENCYHHLSPLLLTAKKLAALRPPHSVRLDIVTANTQYVLEGDQCDNFDLFPLWGVGSVVGNEFGHISVRNIDIQMSPDDKTFNVPAEVFLQYRDESHLAVRANDVYARRMLQKEGATPATVLDEVNTSAEQVRLIYSDALGVKSLSYEREEKAAPADNELEIEVDDVSINFKDFLKVTGMISRKATVDTFFNTAIGMDCAGIVTRTGKNVRSFKVGDQVMGFSKDGAFRSAALLQEDKTSLVPSALSGNHPSHVLLVFSTVIKALKGIARLQKGERILIHNAAGGVGLAAIQYAQHVGAEVYATTSKEEKAAYLHSIGVRNVYKLSNLEFVSRILHDTNGYGVDVVLSAVPGEVFYQSFALLAPYGRYLELGKKDIIDNSALPMQFFSRNLTFSALDLDKVINEKPWELQELFGEIRRGFDEGYYRPLPTAAFSADQVQEAFGLIDRGQNIGKVVVEMKNKIVQAAMINKTTDLIDGGTCLVTGGTKGLGLEVAKWITSLGIKAVLLISRSGVEEGKEGSLLDYFKQKGVEVRVKQVDVSCAGAVSQMIADAERELPPIKAIIHSAMVLDDGLLNDLSEERFLKVMKPKIDGVLNLHRATLHLKIDHFISISSISSLVGNPGQGNYVAANAFLDGFSFFRQHTGRPSSVINLGVLLETGVVKRDKNLQLILESNGIKGFTNADVMKVFEKVISEPVTQVGYFDIDWKLWASNNNKSASLSLFKTAIQESKSRQVASGPQLEVVTTLGELEVNERHVLMVSLVSGFLSDILKMPVEKIGADRGINQLGIDSVMVVELINLISRNLGVTMAPMEFLSGPTVNEISGSILFRLFEK
ncbi:MAG: SDR family NAD(P)-dependent oxidoreductase [Chitinophagaceae bacterium]